MTKKIAISIPDDVAERLAAGDIDNVSAYITEAVRRKIEAEEFRRQMEQRGMKITDEGIERWRRILAEKDRTVGPEVWRAQRERIDRLVRGDE